MTVAGKLIRLGTFDFSSPYNFNEAPRLSRADGYAENTSGFPDGHAESLHQIAVNGPSHSSGLFLACAIGVTVPNVFEISGPDGQAHLCEQLPGGFVQSFDLSVHQSAPCSRHIPPEQQTDPDGSPLYQLEEEEADMHLSNIIAWILDQVQASSVEVEDRPLRIERKAARRFRRPISGS